jgi:hypothetical protein
MTMRRIRLAVLAFAALAALVTGAAAGAVREPVAGRAQAERAGSVELPRAALGAARGLPRAGIALAGPVGQRRAVPGGD